MIKLKELKNSMMISNSLPDKDFIKFWDWFVINEKGYMQRKIKKSKIMTYHQKLFFVWQHSLKTFSKKSDLLFLPSKNKYNLFFESFYLSNSINEQSNILSK